jgi:hypothetical protein
MQISQHDAEASVNEYSAAPLTAKRPEGSLKSQINSISNGTYSDYSQKTPISENSWSHDFPTMREEFEWNTGHTPRVMRDPPVLNTATESPAVPTFDQETTTPSPANLRRKGAGRTCCLFRHGDPDVS